MTERPIDPTLLTEDWEGNNIAVRCPICGKVYVVSDQIHGGERACPKCGKSKATVKGGRMSGGTASLFF
jgi:endogenous inhibitor of DNA gyrase (YacG/DUF329 family)